MKFHVETLGCKVNQVDSEEIIDALVKRGHTHAQKNEAEISVINTCTVTQKADKKSLYKIKKAIANPQNKFIFVTGCYSELEKKLLEKMTGLTGIIKHTEKKKAADFIEKKIQENKSTMDNYPYLPPPPSLGVEGKMHKVQTEDLSSNQSIYYEHTRAFLKIQDGCNAFCTYCRIPYSRGVPVSRNFKDILKQVRTLSKLNTPEIVLTGVNIGEYNYQGERLEDLLKAILNEARSTLVRVSTIEPHSITNGLIKTFAHPNISKHLHLALQGGLDSVLERMNRKYTTAEFLNILKAIREIDPFFAITSDVITGFCGESEKDFADSVTFIEQCAFAKLHVFPYSPRPLTKAFGYKDDVSPKEKKRRVAVLMRLSDQMANNYLEQVKEKPHSFIIENYSQKVTKNSSQKPPADYEECTYYQGTSEYYLKGWLKGDKSLRSGDLLKVKLTSKSPLVFERHNTI